MIADFGERGADVVDWSPEHSHWPRYRTCVCRHCCGWDAYRCAICGAGGPVEPLYRGDDKRLTCWDHRTVQEGLGL